MPKVLFRTVDEYISAFPSDIRPILQTLRQTIKEELPDAEEGISYHMPVFKAPSGGTVYFAAWKKHISIYPFDETITKALPQTTEYKISGKGTIQFPLNHPLPLPLIRQIIRLIIQKTEQ